MHTSMIYLGILAQSLIICSDSREFRSPPLSPVWVELCPYQSGATRPEWMLPPKKMPSKAQCNAGMSLWYLIMLPNHVNLVRVFARSEAEEAKPIILLQLTRKN